MSEVRTKLNELGKVNHFTLRWVPGHTSIPDNEKADTECKAEAEFTIMRPEPFCGVGRNTISEYLRVGKDPLHELETNT